MRFMLWISQSGIPVAIESCFLFSFQQTLHFYAILAFSHFLQIILGDTLRDMTLNRILYTCTSAGVKNPIGFWFFSFKISCIILLERESNIFLYKIFKYKYKIYMRYICIDISHRCFYIHVEDTNNLKCSHHFCESKIGGWIKFSKERCWIGNPSISSCHEMKMTRKVGGENHESISSCLKNS